MLSPDSNSSQLTPQPELLPPGLHCFQSCQLLPLYHPALGEEVDPSSRKPSVTSMAGLAPTTPDLCHVSLLCPRKPPSQLLQFQDNHFPPRCPTFLIPEQDAAA